MLLTEDSGFNPFLGGSGIILYKVINIHDIQVSTSAWVSHTMPLNLYSRKELHEFGVSVHIVEPGGFVTNMTSSARLTTQLYERWAELSEHKREQYGDKYVKTCELSNLTIFIETNNIMMHKSRYYTF